jgi:cell division protein FtsW
MRSEAAMTFPHLRVVRPDEISPEAAKARAERSARRVMVMLLLSVTLLTALGLVMVLSASSVSAFAQYGSSFLFFKKQLIYAAVGTVLAVGVARMRYQAWLKLWVPLLGLSVALLVLVLRPSTGTTVGGAARWIPLGPITLQPSEIAKLAVVTATAAILSKNIRYLDDVIMWAIPLMFVVGSVSVLIMLQPDLGTMMIIALSVSVMAFVAGVRLRTLGIAAVLGLAAGALLIMKAGYRRTRFLSFLHPFNDPRNSGWQIVQSLIALGSGHLFGVGLGASRQKWMYVPNAHTDFIFSILGEELGLMGELLVLSLFAGLVYAGIRIALRAPDTFGRILAGGITAWLGLQALINMGAVTGVLPITGVPLPFMSFGGSSLIVSLVAVGILVSVGRAGAPGARRSRSGRSSPGARSGSGRRRPVPAGR